VHAVVVLFETHAGRVAATAVVVVVEGVVGGETVSILF